MHMNVTYQVDLRTLLFSFLQAVGLGYKSVAHYLIATQRASAEDSSAADSSNKLLSDKSETSCISDQDTTYTKESLEDGETSSKAKQRKTTCCQVKMNSDDCKDERKSESVVTSDSQDDQANNIKDAGCVTPSSKPPRKRANKDAGCITPSSKPPRKRKYERSPDCVASRLRSRCNKT